MVELVSVGQEKWDPGSARSPAARTGLCSSLSALPDAVMQLQPRHLPACTTPCVHISLPAHHTACTSPCSGAGLDLRVLVSSPK